jgi:phenylalanyl-tRNA synthetase alpha subunit
MCTTQQLKTEISQALKVNSTQRDKNLDEKLHSLKVEIFEKVDQSINSRIEHLKMSPQTANEIKSLQQNCQKVSTEYNLIQKLMQRDIEDIKRYIQEDKQWKEDAWEKLDGKFVEKDEFTPVKDRVNKLVGFIWALLIGCGLIVAYWVLRDAGIPTP